MSDVLKDNRLPLGISAAALIVATYIGFVPLMQRDRSDNSAPAQEIAGLQDRISALEANATGPASNDMPEGADNARLRQEIDLIVRGLGNQTGRISRLQDAVEGITTENGQIAPSTLVMDEIALAKRGLVNLTGRINALSERMDALDTAAADIARLQQQMGNVDRALARLATNANTARDERATLAQTLPASGSTGTTATQTDLTEIAQTLEAILQKLEN
ncbi:hypothetical protein [Yoonia sp. BS5-3]|uniref:Uncharacterized protein n=1 Tax=Yoonia phaeophyticola TaxID=3137369 RepID=A0ABZ2V623_9RHOB